MTPSSRLSTKDRILYGFFGGPGTPEDKARALAERPPRWAERTVTGLYSLWAVPGIGWGLGALGWLPVPREAFTMWWLIAINGVGVVVRFINDGVRRHYAKKASEKMKAVYSE